MMARSSGRTLLYSEPITNQKWTRPTQTPIWSRSLKTTTGQNEDDLGDELGRVSMGLQPCEQRTKNSFDNYKK